MAKLGTFLAYVVILVAIALVPLSLWYIYINFGDLDPNTVAAVFTGLIVIFGYRETKKREIASRHFSEKKNAYMGFIKMLVDVIKGVKEGNPVSQEDLLESMYNFRSEMIVWGGTDTIRAFEKYIKDSEENPDPRIGLLAIDNLLRAMRKELGHNDRKLKKGEIVGMFLDQTGKEELKNSAK